LKKSLSDGRWSKMSPKHYETEFLTPKTEVRKGRLHRFWYRATALAVRGTACHPSIYLGVNFADPHFYARLDAQHARAKVEA